MICYTIHPYISPAVHGTASRLPRFCRYAFRILAVTSCKQRHYSCVAVAFKLQEPYVILVYIITQYVEQRAFVASKQLWGATPTQDRPAAQHRHGLRSKCMSRQAKWASWQLRPWGPAFGVSPQSRPQQTRKLPARAPTVFGQLNVTGTPRALCCQWLRILATGGLNQWVHIHRNEIAIRAWATCGGGVSTGVGGQLGNQLARLGCWESDPSCAATGQVPRPRPLRLPRSALGRICGGSRHAFFLAYLESVHYSARAWRTSSLASAGLGRGMESHRPP